MAAGNQPRERATSSQDLQGLASAGDKAHKILRGLAMCFCQLLCRFSELFAKPGSEPTSAASGMAQSGAGVTPITVSCSR